MAAHSAATPGAALRVAGAVAVLAGGTLHAKLALDSYGTDDLVVLFFVNAIASAVVAAWLVVDRVGIAAVAGLGLSVGSLAAFGLSRVGDGVVGFRGVGLDPSPDVLLTLVAEVAAVVLLAAAVVGDRARLLDRLRHRR